MRDKLRTLSPEEISAKLQLGLPTLRDILDALARPGRDPRDDLPPPIFKKGVLRLEDLQPGMELKGTVLNVVDFGAFVDIGLKDSGLVHISQIANRYIKNPYDVVAVGDVVTVWVLSVDQGRRRVSLTMIKPGTPRQIPVRRTQEPRPQRTGRPPRGRRPAPELAQRPAQAEAGAIAAPVSEAPPAAAAAAPPPAPAAINPPPAPSRLLLVRLLPRGSPSDTLLNRNSLKTPFSERCPYGPLASWKFSSRLKTKSPHPRSPKSRLATSPFRIDQPGQQHGV